MPQTNYNEHKDPTNFCIVISVYSASSIFEGFAFRGPCLPNYHQGEITEAQTCSFAFTLPKALISKNKTC